MALYSELFLQSNIVWQLETKHIDKHQDQQVFLQNRNLSDLSVKAA
jgi:hypothetical protein